MCLQILVVAPRSVGLPSPIQYGLRSSPASVDLTVYFSTGVPLYRASRTYRQRPPAEAAFHAIVYPGRGHPTLSGFPVVYDVTSGLDRLPCILCCMLWLGLSVCGAFHIHISRPPAETGKNVYVGLPGAPHAMPGFPFRSKVVSGLGRPPCILYPV